MEQEIKKIAVTPLNKFNCQSFPLIDGKIIYLTQEELDQIGITKCFDLATKQVIDYDNTKDLELAKLEQLRALREPLLTAFDKYKTNVCYGIKEDTNRYAIKEWYRKILDLDEQAINNPPQEIAYYLPKANETI